PVEHVSNGAWMPDAAAGRIDASETASRRQSFLQVSRAASASFLGVPTVRYPSRFDRAVRLARGTARRCTSLRDTCGAVPFQRQPDSWAMRGRLQRKTKLEFIVPYALFEKDERLTRPFRTEREVWEAAEQADLVVAGTHGEKILDNNFEI